jgi:PilZ domain
MPALARLLDRRAVIAVLQREVSVRLVDISRSGCLLMVPQTLPVGMLGRLRIVLDSTNYVGDVRVVRCEALDGSSCKVGVELLWISMAEDVRGDEPAPAFRQRLVNEGLAATGWVQKDS